MSTLFVSNRAQFFDGNGDPVSGGTVEFYEPGTSTAKDVYTDSTLSTPASNPLTLSSAGTCQVWLNGDYKVIVKDSSGVVLPDASTDGINPASTATVSGGNLVANGSFGTAGSSSTEADGWTFTAQSDGTIERVTTDNYDGEACLKMTSDGSGGGQADQDDYFTVSPGRDYEVSFAIKSSVADIRNIVQVRYFDESKNSVSTSSVYDEDTSNPTSWTLKSFVETPPATARFAKVRILGADQSDSTAGNVRFDSVRMVAQVNKQPTEQIFESSGTWNRPTGCKQVVVEVVGGGGAGGGCASATGSNEIASSGGGAGGHYVRKRIDVSSISSSTITVGSGASGDTGSGSSGSDSSWSDGTNTVTASGGRGGTSGSPTSGIQIRGGGGVFTDTSAGGDVIVYGQPGGWGLSIGDSVAGSGNWQNAAGHGGGSGLYGQGRHGGNNQALAGQDGLGYGSGGSGITLDESSGTDADGGDGSDGIVVVTEYY